MRNYYLKHRYFVPPHKPDNGCRGGVRGRDGEDYSLEIGVDQYASPRMIAYCTMIDELDELLGHLGCKSDLARLVMDKIDDIEKELDANLEKTRIEHSKMQDAYYESDEYKEYDAERRARRGQ
tara:strand:- start:122 stop:490 length:369 start_codon:yes stop_codon:yes gene_type:complete